MTEIIFKNRKLNIEKARSFGFANTDNGYVYHADLVNGQMKLTATVDVAGRIHIEVIDAVDGDEYVLHRVADAAGSFVGQVKAEYEEILEKISAECFDVDVFKSEQAKAVIAHVREKYADEFEYLWQKFPDNAVVRRADNRKWYAALLSVSKRKLGMGTDESIEILDLRMKPDDIEKRVDHKNYFPGYHMNKKHWVTVCLDDSVSLDEICAGIDESYRLAAGGVSDVHKKG